MKRSTIILEPVEPPVVDGPRYKCVALINAAYHVSDILGRVYPEQDLHNLVYGSMFDDVVIRLKQEVYDGH